MKVEVDQNQNQDQTQAERRSLRNLLPESVVIHDRRTEKKVGQDPPLVSRLSVKWTVGSGIVVVFVSERVIDLDRVEKLEARS